MTLVTIIGAGNVGHPLAEGLGRAGHSVTSITSATPDGDAVVGLRGADIVVLALPYEAALSLPAAWVDALSGAIVMDATNPLTPEYSALTVGFTSSGAEQIAARLPQSSVIKALNAVLAPNHDPSAFPAGALLVPVAGDDPGEAGTVIELLRSAGFDATYAGPLEVARYIEPAAELLVRLAHFVGNGTGIGLSLARLS